MNDFDRIATVIHHLDQHHSDQPSLDELAAVAGLSPSHFHRLFHRWAGVTPKDFLQCLTAEHAKQRLRDSTSVLDTAFDAGLSGPGRLHDLFVTLEAATPGEFKNGGHGMTIQWGIAETPFGQCSIGWNARGICHLAFREVNREASVPQALRESWPNAAFQRTDREAAHVARSIFNHSQESMSKLKAFVKGTSFQVKVWRALLQIPEGSVTTYGAIARAIGRPNATRAVGTACGSNPVAYLIPCHRVIRQTGVVQGYRWGNDRKQALLAYEGSLITR